MDTLRRDLKDLVRRAKARAKANKGAGLFEPTTGSATG